MGKDTPILSLEDVRILIVDDEDILATCVEKELRAIGADTTRTASYGETIRKFPAISPDLIICDIVLPDGDGFELLTRWKKDHPEMPVILMTAHGAIDSAITALRLGAFDYLQKPFKMKDLIASVRRAAEVATLRQNLSRLKGSEKPITEVNIIGSHHSTQELRKNLARIARSKADTVLIMGESGTGKELAARAIHYWSANSKEPFVEINCASIPETLLESELFGHERGAFTDARERKLGLFEVAKKGTVFLDEIGELPLKLQAKLLRTLEYRRFKRIGGLKDIEFVGRIVAATNKNLSMEVLHKNFRKDLYYRLDVLSIDMTPLAKRREDIADLAQYLVAKLADQLEIAKPQFSESALLKLQSYSWPGNVRELKNVIQRALVLYEPKVITEDHLRFNNHYLHESHESCATIEHLPQKEQENKLFLLPESGVSLEELEKNLIKQALERSGASRTKAAALLGISRHTLRYRLEKHGFIVSHEN